MGTHEYQKPINTFYYTVFKVFSAAKFDISICSTDLYLYDPNYMQSNSNIMMIKLEHTQNSSHNNNVSYQ